MAFSSLDELLSKMSSGKSFRADFCHSSISVVAGRSYEISTTAKYGTTNAWAGTNLAWTTCTDSAGNGTQIFGIPHGGNVSPSVKHIINVGLTSFGAIGHYTLIDIQGYWPGISTNSSTTQNLTGTPSLRYTNGIGCKLFFVQTVAPGGVAHNISLSYTNSGGTTGRSLPRTVAMTPSAVASHISHSGTNSGADNFVDMFLPLAAGDTGVQNVASVTMSAASGAGTGALVLARPLLTVYAPTAQACVERDATNQFPAMPIVKDGACLSWIHTAATSAAGSLGYIDFAWS